MNLVSDRPAYCLLTVSAVVSLERRVVTMGIRCGLRTHVLCLATVALTWASSPAYAIDNATFWEQRTSILQSEDTDILGHNSKLTEAEMKANAMLMTLKEKEMADAFENLNFPPAKNFMTVREEIEASNVFQFISDMPKGAALHMHSSSMVSMSWVIEEITYWPNLYMCYTNNGKLKMKFTEAPDTSCAWQLVSEVRATYPTEDDFNRELTEKLSLWTDDPDEAYPDISSAWDAFEDALSAQKGIVLYRPAYESYLYQALKEFMEDNVLYLEFRGTLTPMYELNGTHLSLEATVAIYRDTVQRFVQDHPGSFYGARFIFAPSRDTSLDKMWENVASARHLKELFPDFVAGFDLVGQEDKGVPLKDFLEPLLWLNEGVVSVPVFYHAGETAWMGMSTDENLIDALLLNATRIGHGYAITKHPRAKALARDTQTPIEVCPVSNQVLKLVDDLRNHPAAGLVAEGFPIVVSSDDPGSWGAKGLSYDFYEAFMALGGAKADLRFLKQLAVNSMQYSSLEFNAKGELIALWLEKWNSFISEFQ
ncbi:adenosine deaminase 2-like [Penaeus japonicus]|uniref:adenosine deaminase 2-like n=1 Tax=Penaeus japonicus TaxID=27405 RepID=UPI001C70D5C5|nr:adenosine deaminase 2-like [Penaeus japonicus]